MHAIVTGATGLVGRHLVQELRQRGWSVTAIVRETSNRELLEKLGATCVVCDLSRENLHPSVIEKADAVFHTVAGVSDWADWSYFTANTIRPMKAVCNSMVAAGCRRLIHFSTVGVYGPPPRKKIVTEEFPLAAPDPHNLYRRAKIESEKIVWHYQREKQLAVTVIRPGMVYGPGDRVLLDRLIPLLRKQKIRFLGDPRVTLPLVHAGDVARAAFLSANSENAVGQAYNVINSEPVTQEEFLNTIAILSGASHVKHRVPYSVAYAIAGAAEFSARLFRPQRPPLLTRYRVFLFGYQRYYSTAKIESALGWEPKISFRSGIQEAVRWQLAPERSS